MTKNDFLSRMERALAPLPPGDRIDILSDYVEHFRAGMESGKTEEDIALSLGIPEELARTYLEQKGAYAAEAPSGPESRAPFAPPFQAPGAPFSTNGGAPVYPATACIPDPGNQAVATVLVVLFNVFLGIPMLFGLGTAMLCVPLLAFGLLIASVALFMAAVAVSGGAFVTASLVCFGIALLALTILLVLATIALVRGMVGLISRYARLCTRICREGRWPVEGGAAV